MEDSGKDPWESLKRDNEKRTKRKIRIDKYKERNLNSEIYCALY